MHALVVRVRINDRDKAERFLKEQIVPGASRAPGFVTGYWVNVGGNQGSSVIVFESEEDAQRAREVWGGPPPDDVATIESFELGEVVAHA
jgi:hypothetical protein